MSRLRHFYTLFLLSFSFGIISCDWDDSMIYDYNPVVLTLQMPDKADQEFLSLLATDDSARQSTILTFQGKQYPLQLAPRPLRYYMPKFEGFQLVRDQQGELFLTFGELDGAKSYNEHFFIQWGNGKTDDIHLHRRFHYDSDIETQWTLNGKKTSHPIRIQR